MVCPLYISAAYHHLHCFRVLLQAGAQPDFNYTGPVCHEALTRGLASCLLDAVLRHGCEVAFIHLLLDHGANTALVPWGESELEALNRRKVDLEALKVFLEARSESKWCITVVKWICRDRFYTCKWTWVMNLKTLCVYCCTVAAAKEIFLTSLLRMPSPADPPVSDQHPQSDGEKKSKPHTITTTATAHQELPAAPKLTTCHLLLFCSSQPPRKRLSSAGPKY